MFESMSNLLNSIPNIYNQIHFDKQKLNIYFHKCFRIHYISYSIGKSYSSIIFLI